MIDKEYLKSHLLTLKIQRDAASKQVAVDERVLRESETNLNRIEGSLTLCRNLLQVADSMAKNHAKAGNNGSATKHS